MQPIVIAIIVVVIILFGSIGLLIFNSSQDDTEKEEEETVTISGADAESCNKLGYYSNTKVASATTCSALGYTTVDETSCKSFIDNVKANESTCKALGYSLASTSSPITLQSTFCKDASDALNAYVDSLVSLFSSKKLIRLKSGTNITYYYDPNSTSASPSPVTLTVVAIETGNYKTNNVKTVKQLFAILKNDKYDDLPSEFKGGPVMGHIATILGIVGNDDKVSWMKDTSTNSWAYDKSPTKLTGDGINKYTFVDCWSTIENSTYSYLNITSTRKTSIINELKKAGVSKYGMYCV